MNKNLKNYSSLIIWISLVVSVGFIIGYLTKPSISTWYSKLNKSILTPPNYVFPIAWSILYTLIGICGWLIWPNRSSNRLKFIKSAYITQLFLNWSWPPLFFRYHFTDISMVVLILMNIFVASIIYLSYNKIKLVSWLMIPYFAWILFASYLNFYICLNN